MKKFVCAVAVATLVSGRAYAQDRKESPDISRCRSAAEIGSDAPWYNVTGPRISGECSTRLGDFSLIYVPVRFTPENEGDQGLANNVYASWHIPVWKIGVAPFFDHSEWRGNGGGVLVKTRNMEKYEDPLRFAGRIAAFRDAAYGEGKLLSRHAGIDVGAKREKNGEGKYVTNAYGYVTANFGKHDDTISIGIDSSKTWWNNFSVEREKFGMFSLNGAAKGYWTTDTFFGIGDLDRVWYSRLVDELVPSQFVNPKETSAVLTLTSYLGFASGVTGEARAEHSSGRTFAAMSVGYTLSDEGVKIGTGAGVQCISGPNAVPEIGSKDPNGCQPIGEVYLAYPNIGGLDISLTARFREIEGGFQVTIRKKF